MVAAGDRVRLADHRDDTVGTVLRTGSDPHGNGWAIVDFPHRTIEIGTDALTIADPPRHRW